MTPRTVGPQWIVVIGTTAAPVIVLASHLFAGTIPMMVVIGAWLTALAGAIFFFMRSFFRVRRLLRRHGRFICLNCLYPLTGLQDSGVCPECNEPYTRERLARLWRSWEVGVNKGRLIIPDPEPADDGPVRPGTP